MPAMALDLLLLSFGLRHRSVVDAPLPPSIDRKRGKALHKR
jgi:hypothetical protein